MSILDIILAPNACRTGNQSDVFLNSGALYKGEPLLTLGRHWL
jgi:hypothetical protein